MYSFQDDFGVPMTLTFDEEIFSRRPAGHVLVFAVYESKLLFTLHTKRGIEIPGGKVEPGETSLAAAVRELYEETGFALASIEKIGQYTVGDTIVKDIFFARAERQIEAMIGGTVGGVITFDTIPLHVKGDSKFSRFMYDDVYPLTISYLASRGLLPTTKK